MHKVSRTFDFSYAHCIPGHPKCGRLHGHNAKVVVSLSGIVDPSTGFVTDFGDLKKVFEELFGYWDHRFLSHASTATLSLIYEDIQRADVITLRVLGLEEMNNIVALGFLSTAENLSEFMAKQLAAYYRRTMPKQIIKVQVDFFETDKCCATSWALCSAMAYAANGGME